MRWSILQCSIARAFKFTSVHLPSSTCAEVENWEYLLAYTKVSDSTAEAILSKLAALGKVDKELWENHRMTFDEILENLQAQDPKALLYDALDELEKSVVVAATAADKASKAYYADATAKAEKISARVGLLRKQHSEFQKKIEALKKPLLEVTVSGNTQKLADLKASMDREYSLNNGS